MKQKITAYILSVLLFGVTFVVTAACSLYAMSSIGFTPLHIPESLIFVYAALNFFIPAILAIVFTGRIFKRLCGPDAERQKTVFSKKTVYTIAVLYLLTLTAGIPAVQSHNSAWGVDEYKDSIAGNDLPLWKTHPRIKSYFSAPILPFVLITYHDYQFSGLYGWGGWDVQLWYVFGVKGIASLTVWVS